MSWKPYVTTPLFGPSDQMDRHCEKSGYGDTFEDLLFELAPPYVFNILIKSSCGPPFPPSAVVGPLLT